MCSGQPLRRRAVKRQLTFLLRFAGEDGRGLLVATDDPSPCLSCFRRGQRNQESHPGAPQLVVRVLTSVWLSLQTREGYQSGKQCTCNQVATPICGCVEACRGATTRARPRSGCASVVADSSILLFFPPQRGAGAVTVALSGEVSLPFCVRHSCTTAIFALVILVEAQAAHFCLAPPPWPRLARLKRPRRWSRRCSCKGSRRSPFPTCVWSAM